VPEKYRSAHDAEKGPLLARLRTGKRQETERTGELPAQSSRKNERKREELSGTEEAATGELEGRTSRLAAESGATPIETRNPQEDRCRQAARAEKEVYG
jgi:hypothetical protein